MAAREQLQALAKTAKKSPLAGQEMTRHLGGVETPSALVKEALLRSPGNTLEPAVRGQMEARLGHDFSQVRVHTDARAATAAYLLEAVAFTVGRHIFFAEGAYQPGTIEGRRLLAHELVHVAQQKSVTPVGDMPLAVTQASDPLEYEATEIADQIETSAPLLTTTPPQEQGQPAISRQRAATRMREAVTVPDPSQVIDSLVRIIQRNLFGDPHDRAGRIRRQFSRLEGKTREEILRRLEKQLSASQFERLNMLLAEPAPTGTEVSTPAAPESTSEEIGEETAASPTEEAEETRAETRAQAPDDVEAKKDVEPGKEPGIDIPGIDKSKDSEEEEAKAEADSAEGPQTPVEPAIDAQTGDEAQPKPEATAEAGTAELEAETATDEAAQVAAGEAPSAQAPAGAQAATVESGPTGGGETADEGSLNRAEEVLMARAGVNVPSAPSVQAPAEPEVTTAPEADITSAEPAAAVDEIVQDDEAMMAGEAAPANSATEADSQERSEVSSAAEPSAGSVDENSAQSAAGAEEQPEASASLPETQPAEAQDDSEPAAAEAIEADVSGGEEADTAPAAMAPEPTDAPEAIAQEQIESPAAEVQTPAIEESAPDGVGAEPRAGIPGATSAEEAAAPETATAAPTDETPAAAGAASGAAAAGQEGQGAQANCQGGEASPAEMEQAGGEGGGACGGGGGAAAEQSAAPTPDVSGAEPAEAVAQMGSLAPAEAQAALSGVNQSVNQSVSGQRNELANAPPQMERPSGAPPGSARTTAGTRPAPSASGAPPAIERVGAAAATAAAAQAQGMPSDVTLPQAQTPRLPGNGELTPNDVQQVRTAVSSLPTTDPALNVNIQTPQLTLNGEADPALVQTQSTQVTQSVSTAHQQAQQDVVQPMGEDQVYPIVPQETLNAEAGGGAGGENGAQGGGGQALAPDDPVAIVAREESQGQVRNAANQARSEMVSSQQQHVQESQTERSNSQRQMDEEVNRNAEEQAQERSSVQTAVRSQRTNWTREQTTVVDGAQTERDGVHRDNQRQIADQRAQGERQAAEHTRQGNTEIGNERRNAEGQARQERQRAQNETSGGGFFSWLASRVTAFFDGIKRAIQAAFDAARRAVQAAFQRFQQLAMQAIEATRQAVVSAIRAAGDLLIAIGDRVLGAFPALRDRFRQAIQEAVAQAEAAVNALADALKAGIQRLLNFLMGALMALINLLQAGLLAIVNGVARVIQGAIEAARAIAQGLGQFIELIGDIASNPGQWLRNLGSSVVSGIRNCLWSAFKLAVKNWFNQKVEEVLGLGLMIYRILMRGCISMAMVGSMAWGALKSAIPMVLIGLLIEKLVSMIIPAAGAILTIIQGLMAAWGTVSRIITAFQLFFTFLRAVKNGNAGPQFANAVAAAAVVVIDFVANWLLQRLMRPARGVGGRLRTMAQRIMQRVGGAARRAGRAVRRGARAARRGAGRAVAAVRRGATRAAQAIRRGAGAARRRVGAAGRAIVRRTGAVGRTVARGARAVARAVRRGVQALRRRVQAMRDRWRRRREERRRQRQRNAQERANRAGRALEPRIDALLRPGVPALALRARLGAWRLYYRLRAIQMVDQGDDFHFVAIVNPPSHPFARGTRARRRDLLSIVRWVADDILNHPRIGDFAERLEYHRLMNPGQPLNVRRRGGITALVRMLRDRASRGRRERQETQNFILGSRAPRPFKREDYRLHGTQVREMQRFAPTDAYVMGVDPRTGREIRGQGNYAALVGRLRAIEAATGKNSRELAQAIHSFMVRGRVPRVFEPHRPTIAEFIVIYFGREAVRNRASIVTHFMMLNMVMRGSKTWHQALITENPMQPSRSGSTSRDVERRLNREADRLRGVEHELPSTLGQRRELRTRERNIIVEWLRAEVMVSNRLFKTLQGIYEYIRTRAMRFYGLND